MLIALLSIAAVASVALMRLRYDITEDISEVLTEAKALYEAGETERAITRLEAYCAYSATDTDSAILLGDWYYKKGDRDTAYQKYALAAENKKTSDGVIAPLSVKNKRTVMADPVSSYRIEITPDVRMTKDMTLFITSSNLAPSAFEAGRIERYEEVLYEEERYLTTPWFAVSPEGGHLTMSGGFNCARWQFKDADGEIIACSVSSNTYRSKTSFAENIYQMARVIIPEKAAECRVTYFDNTKRNSTASNDEPLSIVYGWLMRSHSDAKTNTYKIPDLSEGDKIIYENGEWTLVSNDRATHLLWEAPQLERGSYVEISGTLLGRVDFTGTKLFEYNDDNIYTIRFDKNSASGVGERQDSAVNLEFNAANGNSMLNLGKNDFDNIYPWSEMKPCVIENGEIFYESDAIASNEKGNVFIEIPKFYSKRVSDENYETISISKVPQAGFNVDDAFLTQNGEADKIYIAAYLSSEEEGVARSVSGEAPRLNISKNEAVYMAEANGEGYHEIDYAALSAIQKLFMVETGFRNSQTLYLGVCALNMPTDDMRSGFCALAKASKRNTNCITISDKFTFNEGDSVIIYEPLYYGDSINSALSNVRTVTTIIKNSNRTQTVYFSGDPMYILMRRSAISQVSSTAGRTNVGEYMTYAESIARGTVPFKYRGIENIWGSAFVYIDNISINEGVVTVTDRKGEAHTLSYSLPEPHMSEDGGINISLSMISELGYDEIESAVMLPAQTEGASASTYYGDAFIYDMGEGERALTHGGTWNAKLQAGLFCYDASLSPNERSIGAAGRMMYIP